MSLCDACQNIEFNGLLDRNSEQTHKENFRSLKKSAKTCDSCAVILQALFTTTTKGGRRHRGSDVQKKPARSAVLVDVLRKLSLSHFFKSDDGRPIILGGVFKDWSSFDDIDPKERGAHLLNLQVSFPGKSRSNGIRESHIRRIRIYAQHGSAAARSGDILGRPVESPRSVSQIQKWQELCQSGHPMCHPQEARSDNRIDKRLSQLPTRVVEVALSNGSEILRLYESNGERGEYVTLSYRWGDAKFIQTTTSTITVFSTSISISTLCRTFQDAIFVTRKLGIRYIWIDALCIIQDSPEDWNREAARMADIYMQSSLTLSASIATSADSGLFSSTTKNSGVNLPYKRRDGLYDGVFSLSNEEYSSFDNDIVDGSLSKRGWCLQERLLSRQIVHYGENQLHWECSSAIWSEESSINQHAMYDSLNDLHSYFLFSEVLDSDLYEDPAPQIQYKGRAGSWYSMLSDYTYRSLTKEEDRLPAVAGLAKAFAARTNLTYVAGLWRGEMAIGLLWIGDRGETLSTPQSLSYSPSWSWANFPGAINYPLERIGKIVVEEVEVSAHSTGLDGYVDVNSGSVTFKGYLQSLERLQRKDRKPGEWVKTHQTVYEQERTYVMQIDFDDRKQHPTTGIYCLMMAHVGCGASTTDCGHGLVCLDKLAMALLIHPEDGASGLFRKIGVAKVYQSGFDGVEMETITIV